MLTRKMSILKDVVLTEGTFLKQDSNNVVLSTYLLFDTPFLSLGAENVVSPIFHPSSQKKKSEWFLSMKCIGANTYE